MRQPLLVEYFQSLPERSEGEAPESWAVRLQEALDKFKFEVANRYNEGSLQRILVHADDDSRKAAILALSLIGTMSSNKVLAARLQHENPQVRQMAGQALWALWFRADTEDHNRELQRLMAPQGPAQALAGLDALIARAPRFAEAYNQRAILHFRQGQLQKAIADCDHVIRINPWHFGAHAGMGQCYLKLKKHRAALRSFRNALRINPDMKGVEQAIRSLEESLGEEGRKDDRNR